MSRYDKESHARPRARTPHRSGNNTERRGNESVTNVKVALTQRDLVGRRFINCITGCFPTQKQSDEDRALVDAWLPIVEDDRDFPDLIGVAKLGAQIKSSVRGEYSFVKEHSDKLLAPIGSGSIYPEYGLMLFNGQRESWQIRRDFGIELLQIAGMGSNPAHRDVQDFLRLCLHPDLAKDVAIYLQQLQRKGHEDGHIEMYRGANIFQRALGVNNNGKKRR